jgi:hypothetical protein
MGETLSDAEMMAEMLADCREGEARARRDGDEREAGRWKAAGDAIARMIAIVNGGGT